MHTITSICLQLKEHKQRASLGAVAKVLELNTNVVFSGKPKYNHLYSWVITSEDNKYHSGQDPELAKAEKPIITDAKVLSDWLDDPENQSHASDEFVFLLERMAN